MINKKIFILILTLIIVITFFNFTSLALNNKEPTTIFIGLPYGKVASIDLEDWQIIYYPTKLNRRWNVHDIKYYPDVNKVVFMVGEYDYQMGIIRVPQGKVNYIYPDVKTSGNKIIDYTLEIKKPNLIYVEFAEKPWQRVSEKEVENFRRTIELVKYNIKKEKWNKINIKGWENINEYIFKRYIEDSRNHNYKKDILLRKLINQNILPKDATTNDILLKSIGEEVSFYGDYFMCKKNGYLIIVKVNKDKFKIINKSPNQLVKTNPEIFKKTNVVEFAFEDIDFNSFKGIDNELNIKGEKAYKNGDIFKAIEYYQEAITYNSGVGQYYSNLGLAYQKIEKYQKSIKANKKAIRITEKDVVKASSHYNIAQAYEKQEKWEKALQHYQKALKYKEHSAYKEGVRRMKNKMD